MTELPPPRKPLEKASPWPFVGMIGMACVAFLIGASVLAAPWFVVLVLSLLWVVTLVVALVWWSRHPTWLPWLPLGLAVAWIGSVAGGAALFGWGA
ncbi:MAG TPA: hypothetical protein VF468_23595 [Actinomycetota bacterium]|nr:hypothetical protein [Actinomycetota bacterium]